MSDGQSLRAERGKDLGTVVLRPLLPALAAVARQADGAEIGGPSRSTVIDRDYVIDFPVRRSAHITQPTVERDPGEYLLAAGSSAIASRFGPAVRLPHAGDSGVGEFVPPLRCASGGCSVVELSLDTQRCHSLALFPDSVDGLRRMLGRISERALAVFLLTRSTSPHVCLFCGLAALRTEAKRPPLGVARLGTPTTRAAEDAALVLRLILAVDAEAGRHSLGIPLLRRHDSILPNRGTTRMKIANALSWARLIDIDSDAD
jgi:hypothetical protein